jgi:hypothetical protein
VVDIDTPENTGKSEVVVQIDTGGKGNDADPAAGADSDGTEQSIQAEPTKPGSPENPTPVEKTKTARCTGDRAQQRNPPTYKPEQTTGTTPSSRRAARIPAGFGYIESSGEVRHSQ